MTKKRADEILIGAVLTMDDAGSRAEAVAIADGAILATGTREAMLELRGPRTAVRDFPGCTILPGFNDTHAHMDSIGARLVRPSLEEARSIADVQARIRALAQATPKGEWIVTMPVGTPPFYFDGPSALAEGRMPNRHELDAAAPDHPVYIPSPGGYWGEPPCHAALNSRALQLNGIDRHTRPTSPNTVMETDTHGEPTGVFVEKSYVNLLEPDLLPAVPRFTYDERRDGVTRAMALYHRMGTTSIYEGHGSAPDVLAAYKEVWERGDLTMRTSMVVSPRWRSIEEAEVVMRDWSPLLRGRGIGDAWFRVSGFFIAHGGDPNVQKVQQKDLQHVSWAGFTQQANSTADFEALCLLAGRYDLRVHTIVSDKLALVAPVIARLAQRFPIGERRWVLEHVSRSSPADLATIRNAGVAVTLIPGQYIWKHATPFMSLSEEELDYLSPARQLHELGVPVSAGTDAVPYNPLFCLWAMTTRKERHTGRTIGARGIVSPEVGLRLLTRAGAYLSFEEHVKGQLVPGHYADIAVLDGDPLALAGDALLDLQCRATLVGGKWVHGITG
ncbi:MAG TPA: amidohydrolase family protein [Burkholderiales bacterium]|nr:amidohydrolase family protein [Burkholderiales bacterium]